jgi:hypothetical protein
MRSLALSVFFVLFCFNLTWSQNAYITSVLINSCNGTCQEGDNEIIFGNTGAGSLLVNSANLQINYSSTSPALTSYTDPLTTNPTTTSALNAAAGCPLFVEAVGTTIPANAAFIVVRNTICTSALNWTGLCGSAPIYIVYSADPSWSATGNFGNGTGINRFLRSTITTSAGTATIDYTYNLPVAFNNDGAFANWNNTGGNAVVYGDNNCAITPTSLDIAILDFQLSSDKTSLTWLVQDNHLIDFFEIQFSKDGQTFQQLATIYAEIDITERHYTYTIPHEYKALNGYYRLIYTDKNGRNYEHPRFVHQQEKESTHFIQKSQTIANIGRFDVNIYSLFGVKICTLKPETEISIQGNQLVLVQTIEDIHKIFIPSVNH